MGVWWSLVSSVFLEGDSVEVGSSLPPQIDEDTERRFQMLLSGVHEPVQQDNQVERPPWLQPQLIAEARQLHMKRWSDINNAQVSSLFLISFSAGSMKLLLATGKSDTAAKAKRRYMETGLYTLTWALGDVWQPGDPAYSNAERVVGMHSRVARIPSQRPLSSVHPPENQSPPSTERQRTMSALQQDMAAQKETLLSEATDQIDTSMDPDAAPPVSQASMAVTQWMFVAPVLLHPHQYGLGQLDDRQLTAFVHLWRSIGCRLGTRDSFNLCEGSLDQVRALCWLIERRMMVPSLCRLGVDWQCLTDSLFDGLSLVLPIINYEAWLTHTLHDVLQLHVPRLQAALGWRSFWLYRMRRAVASASSRSRDPPVHQEHLLKLMRRACEQEGFSQQLTYVLDLL